MNMFVLDNEIYVRLGFFLGVFAFMAIWEIAAPRRAFNTSKISRWCNNITITFLNSVVIRLIFPVTALGVALIAKERGWGILNIFEMGDWTAGVIAIVALDFIIYLQHRLFHSVKALWRIHMVHHTDLDIDVTTGARFHPFEIILSMIIKMIAIVLIGAPAWSVLTFEVLLNGASMFNHGNAFIALRIDSILRKFIVTPDMHRVHHSVLMDETNSNFGFNLPWWDYLFGTYRDQPAEGHQGMTIGLPSFRDPNRLTLQHILALPIARGNEDLFEP